MTRLEQASVGSRLARLRRALPALGFLSAACGSSGSEPAAVTSASKLASSLTVSIQTYAGNYLVADQGGGAALMAYSTWAKGWETFTLEDLDGGALESGDVVTLQGALGQWVSAADGGGGALTVTAPWQRAWEQFRILKLSGNGAIGDGDTFALQTVAGGQYVSVIDGGGGIVTATAPWTRSWETLTLRVSGGAAGGGGNPVGPRASLLGFLQSISGSKTMAGEHDREAGQGDFIQAMHDVTGHYPALWGGDFLFESDAIQNRPNVIQHLMNGWRGGAVIDLMYHACPPTQGEACAWQGGVLGSLSDAEWSDLVTDGGSLNRVWKSRLDAIAPYFQELKDAGMGALFRPHHEMNQGAFWWGGRPGAGGTAALYRLTHDYLTNTKGLDNIVWVWSVQDIWDSGTNSWNFGAYDPGDAYWDVMSLDFYDGKGFTPDKYAAMLAVAGSKPIAIGECQALPAASELAAQPRWVYFMGWAELVQQNDSNAAITSVYTAPNVLTEDEMPPH